ncbi:MAG TPA: ATP-dependent helicase, partial [Anaerolineae bacterium]|nr:ATP-dependent helicase [Anaerolineae bacterium]
PKVFVAENVSGLVKGTANAFTRQAKDLQLAPEALRERLADLAGDLPLAGMGAAIYADYQRALAYRGAVDFDDLIRLALQALESDEALLLRLRQRWPYILEDEAQDSSRLQERILRTLAGPAGNWVRVGDPNQAIFETFTTASPEHLRRFLREEGVAAQDLPNSGRSTLSIIDLANRLIDWTMQAHPEPAVRSALSLPHIEPTPPGDPQPNPPDDPAAIFLMSSRYSPDGEVRALVESLARWLPNNPKATVAVLVPRNQRGFDLVDALRGRGLPVVDSLLRSTLTTRQAAGALANLLLYLADPTVATKLARVYEVWRRDQRDEEDKAAWEAVQKISKLLRRIEQVEDFVWPRAGRDWLAEAEIDGELRTHLEEFRALVQRWQGAVLLPIDQTLLTLAQDLFSEPGDLALAHKLAVSLQIEAERRPDWRLPELANELTSIARNERRFIGFSEEDSGFDPNKYAGQVVVATIHKAKGLEWDRVYLMSVNSYDFPSAQPYDQYIAEKWFLRQSRQVQTGGPLNLQAEALEQLKILAEARDPAGYIEGAASQQARLDYVRERLRLLYVGITRSKKELIITWNTGRPGPNQADLTQALPFVALQAYWERN